MDRNQRKERVNRYSTVSEMGTKNPRKHHTSGLFQDFLHCSTPGLQHDLERMAGVGMKTSALGRPPTSPAPPTPGSCRSALAEEQQRKHTDYSSMETPPLRARAAVCKATPFRQICSVKDRNLALAPTQTHSSGVFGFVFTGLDSNKQTCTLLRQRQSLILLLSPVFPKPKHHNHFSS